MQYSKIHNKKAILRAFVFMQHIMVKFKPNLKNKYIKVIQNFNLTLLAWYGNSIMK